MKNSILSATFSFAIFLDAAATFGGGQWTEVPGGAAPHSSQLDCVAVVSANDIWAVGTWGGANGLVEHWDGTNWSVAAVQAEGSSLYGVAARSSRDVWAVGSIVVPGGQEHTLAEHWNGRRWAVVPSPNVGTYNELNSVCVISHNDAWAVGNSFPDGVYILMHWDGTSWSLVDAPPANGSALSSLKAFATDDVWAVGEKDFDVNQNTGSTFTLHWDGATWSEVPSPNVSDDTFLHAVDGAAPNDVWAVGYSGFSSVGALTMHWDGTDWTVVPTPVDGSFSAVKASSATNVWAVGSNFRQPISARWDGTQWRVVPTPPVFENGGGLNAISERNGSVWAVGYQGFFSHRTSGYDLILNWTP